MTFGGGGPIYGRKINGEYEQLRPGDDPPPSASASGWEATEEENEDEEEPPDAYYAVSGDQEDYGYGVRSPAAEMGQQRQKDDREKAAKREAGNHPEGGHFHRGPSGRGGAYGSEQEDYYGGGPPAQWSNQPGMDWRHYGPEEGDIFREVRRTGDFGREYVMDRGHRPDNRYYGPQGPRQQEEEDEEYRRRRRLNRHHHHGARWGEQEGPEEEEEGHYEGPTIFDKVFRRSTKRKSVENSRSRSRSPLSRHSSAEPAKEKKRRPPAAPATATSASAAAGAVPDTAGRSKDELEAEFKKYKEKTEARIRRERERLERYERKIMELTQLSDGVKARPLDIAKYERRKRRAEQNIAVSPPKAYKQSRPDYSSDSGSETDSDGESLAQAGPPSGLPQKPTREVAPSAPPKGHLTPPPGSNLRPILSPEGDGEYLSDEEDDTEYLTRTGGGPAISPEQDSCENKFDPD